MLIKPSSHASSQRTTTSNKLHAFIYKMSRALDPDTVAPVDNEVSQRVYHDIVEALCQDRSDLLEIEFLGKSYPLPAGCNVLVDGNSIGIPKGKLVQAFLVARKLFFRSRNDPDNTNPQDIRHATAIILLMDPEHLTAANARKRLIQSYQRNSPSHLEKELNRELQWLDSMLTARLHRHTKSPTLWDHRRWILGVWKSVHLPRDLQSDLTNVVLVSAERHPRNYYAWLHLRWLFKNLHDNGSRKDIDSKLLSTVSHWCLRNPADIAGFSFLLFCLSRFPGDKERIDSSTGICTDVLGPTNSFQWVHESVWVFLRTLVASGQVVEKQTTDFFNTIESFLIVQKDNYKAQIVLQAARDWCIEYGIKS
jgi:protein prenyltransferase alpha subunit repeat containing protein 1